MNSVPFGTVISHTFWHELEKYIESELSGIFWVKPVAKHIVFGSAKTRFVHLRVNNNNNSNNKPVIKNLLILGKMIIIIIVIYSFRSFSFQWLFYIFINKILGSCHWTTQKPLRVSAIFSKALDFIFVLYMYKYVPTKPNTFLLLSFLAFSSSANETY